MADILLDGTPAQTIGDLPAVGSKAPGFVLVGTDLQDKTLDDFPGQCKILNIVPSLATGVCSKSAKTFNEKVGAYQNAVLLTISADLPFASKQACDDQDLRHIVCLSNFRNPEFGRDYGVLLLDSIFKGLLSRAVVVLDEANTVLYTEQVPDIGSEPDYDAALSALP